MTLLAEYYCNGGEKWNTHALASRVKLPDETVDEVIEYLIGKGLIIETADDPACYVPAHDPAMLKLDELLNTLRSAGEADYLFDTEAVNIHTVERVLDEVAGKRSAALAGRSLRDLL